MNKSQLFDQFISNNAVTYSGFWVQSASLKSYVENVNHLPTDDSINISKFSCKSEVNIEVSNGFIEHSFVFGLLIHSDFEALINNKAVNLSELSPELFMNYEIATGYTAYLTATEACPDRENLQSELNSCITDGYVGDDASPELHLRRAMVAEIDKQLLADIAEGKDTELVRQISAVAKQSLTESISAINSVARAIKINEAVEPIPTKTADKQINNTELEAPSLVLNLDTDNFVLLPVKNKLLSSKIKTSDDNDYCMTEILDADYQSAVTMLQLNEPAHAELRAAFANYCITVSGYGIPIMCKAVYALMYDSFVERGMNAKQMLEGLDELMADWKEENVLDYLLRQEINLDGVNTEDFTRIATEHIQNNPEFIFQHACCFNCREKVYYKVSAAA